MQNEIIRPAADDGGLQPVRISLRRRILAWAFLTGWTVLRKDAGALHAAALSNPLPQANP